VQALQSGYGKIRVLHGIDIEIAAGEVVALLGPNGAGKTTLISIICGIVNPTEGAVRVHGHAGQLQDGGRRGGQRRLGHRADRSRDVPLPRADPPPSLRARARLAQ